MISSRSNVKFNSCQEGSVLLELNALRMNRPDYELTLEDEYVGGLMMKLLTTPEYTHTHTHTHTHIEHISLCFEAI